MKIRTENDAPARRILGGGGGRGSLSSFIVWFIRSCLGLPLLILVSIWGCVIALGPYVLPVLINLPLTNYIISCVPTVTGTLGFMSAARKARRKWKVKCSCKEYVQITGWERTRSRINIEIARLAKDKTHKKQKKNSPTCNKWRYCPRLISYRKHVIIVATKNL